MDASWWPAVAVVVVLALIATVADSFGRVRRAHARPAGPRPGEVWWARVPYRDGDGGGDAEGAGGDGEARPCLVLKTADGTVTVAPITTRRVEGRPGVIPLPPGSAGGGLERPGFLETDELHEVAVADFRRKAGPVDPGVWDRVRHLADT
ncbi:type II toxin-antitoxin system PemK/MazF family toxin [Streptomyces sp. 184]|uniref:type II toxin-antitoxin system PemK/MazF family toxin n=1 Tax=Streptomyces sp. 184 TaxID=1827526 RepID=UPI0038921F7A